MNRDPSLVLVTALCVLLVGCARSDTEPLPAPSVLLAALESETLFPSRQSGPCDNFFGEAPQLDDDAICVANNCGFGQALLEIDAALVGRVDRSHGALRYALGEWCEPAFPLTSDLLLIAVDSYDATNGEHAFRFERTFQTKDGERYFVPELITEIDGIDLRQMAKPLPEPLVYGDVDEFAAGEIEALQSSGFVTVRESTVAADLGVYVGDLKSALEERAAR